MVVLGLVQLLLVVLSRRQGLWTEAAAHEPGAPQLQHRPETRQRLTCSRLSQHSWLVKSLHSGGTSLSALGKEQQSQQKRRREAVCTSGCGAARVPGWAPLPGVCCLAAAGCPCCSSCCLKRQGLG